MVTAGEDVVAAGETACQALRGGHGFATGLEKTNGLGAGNDVDETLGDLHLQRMGVAEDDPVDQLAAHGIVDFRY